MTTKESALEQNTLVELQAESITGSRFQSTIFVNRVRGHPQTTSPQRGREGGQNVGIYLVKRQQRVRGSQNWKNGLTSFMNEPLGPTLIEIFRTIPTSQ